MITACLNDWSAHVIAYGRCVNGDLRYQEKKALLVIRSNLTWKKTRSMREPRYNRYRGVTIRVLTGFYCSSKYTA